MPKTDAELIGDAEDSLQVLHGLIDDAGNPEQKAALAAHHLTLNACLNRYNEVYAPSGEPVALRSGGNKPDGVDDDPGGDDEGEGDEGQP